MFFNTLLAILIVSSTVCAHGTITSVQGANGVQGAGMGIIPDTPRDGSRARPFQQDTSILRNSEINSGRTGVCGRTPAGGNNDVAAQLQAASEAGLPTTAADGSLTMTLHQVNQDGAGPFNCDVSGDGQTFQDATVTQNVPGFIGLSGATAKDFPLVATVPAGMTCTAGPNGDACIMRCRNGALAGPFGSCVAFAMGDGATASGNSTAAASTASTGASGGSSGATKTGAKKGGLFGGLFGRSGAKKRYINSRVAGRQSGLWM